jgi:hypothetical protein
VFYVATWLPLVYSITIGSVDYIDIAYDVISFFVNPTTLVTIPLKSVTNLYIVESNCAVQVFNYNIISYAEIW